MKMTLARTIASGSKVSDGRSEVTIVTRSGFTVMVMAHQDVMCTPLVTCCENNDVYEGEEPCGECDMEEEGWEPCDYEGPFTHLQVVQPSERPEPWDKWKKYLRFKFPMSEPWKSSPFDNVPVAMVLDLIREHGGEIGENTF